MTLSRRIRFYQQLAVLSRAGVPLRGSFERLRERLRAPEIAVLSERINSGERIGEAFAAAGFSSFECHLVAAGERSAKLDAVFEHLAEYWSRDRQLRQALVRQLIYPIVVLHLVILVSSIIDGVTGSFALGVTHFILRIVVFYALGAGLYIAVRTTWSSESARRIWFFVPLVGSTLAAAFSYRWITALRAQFTAGITLSRAVGDAWRASGYAAGEEHAREAEEALRQGTSLSALMERWRQLPRDWVDFVETGEISGKLEEAFTALEDEAARSWRAAHERLSEWGPKIAYFAALIFVAFQVGTLMYKVEVQPIEEVEKAIDDAGH